MIILGVDPALAITGYGVIQVRGTALELIEAGIIQTSPKEAVSKRLNRIYRGVLKLISDTHVDCLVLEKIYSHYKHPATAILMGHARAAVCLVSGMNEIRLVNYPSTEIIKTISGNGQGSKQQVQRMVQNLLKLKKPPEPVDVSDALAIAMSYCFIEKKRTFDDIAYKG